MENRRKKIIKYIIPSVLTSVCFIFLNIADGIFVGKGVGSNGLGAVNIAYPLVMIVLALAMMTTIGGVAITAIHIGRNDKESANKAFMHSFILTLILSVMFMIAGIFFTKDIALLLGASDLYLQMVIDYLFWYCIFAVPNIMAVNLQSFCRNDGSPVLVGVSTITSMLLNLFLDWLFVLPLQMGLAGAAIATGISQIVACVIVAPHFIFKKGILKVRIEKFDKKLFAEILYRGIPDMISQFATPIMTITFNRLLIMLIGSIGVNTFSIITYITSFALFMMIGISEGFQPLFGQTYGKKDKEGLMYYLKRALMISFVIGIIGVAFSFIFDNELCILFSTDQQTLAYTIECIPKFAWGFIVAGLNIVISAFFYSTKQTGFAIVLNVIRSFIASAFIIAIIPILFGAETIWYAYGISESIVLLLAMSLLAFSLRKGINYNKK